MTGILRPAAQSPGDLAGVKAVPLRRRGLTASTYEVVMGAAQKRPRRTEVTVLPDATDYPQCARRTFDQLANDATLGKSSSQCDGSCADAVMLISPNCDELITATLAAQAVGIAAPIHVSLSGQHTPELDLSGMQRAAQLAGAPANQPGAVQIVGQVSAGTPTAVLALGPAADCAAVERMAKSFAATCEIEEQ